ncbi:type II toxin-antitoxin system RnlB family antitoxin [Saccharibacillus brassicae]|uniref:Type II toxin-antitoxin system RnlB family antitoxin n=1 Tax=Saccharibacillus brassicae TaxID=2583377 RepID=A0A4Y6UW84_SACBS|nr:type II toxin-antitoxin system RnlB family antitoxin [Saccharibacillus brassicae]QDH20265.1 type II toxin-antitoxin system RnlB family antitoxin [Saccharibacillus brassicae]
MENYELLNFKSDRRKVVLSTSYASPLGSVYLISNELAKENYHGEVLFDLLLSNGFNPNRFLSMVFDGERLVSQTTKIINEIPKSLLIEIYEFYYEHIEYIEKSSLPDIQKYLLKNNKVAENLSSS